MYKVIMPRLGLTMKIGKIEKWYKKEGEYVEQGELLLLVMTDKVSLEVEAEESGVLRKILKDEGEEVPVTEVIAFIGDKDEEIPTISGEAKLQKREVVEGEKKEVKIKESEEATTYKAKHQINISSLAVKAAIELGIDYKLEPIKGTGPRGKIVKEDILAYYAAKDDKVPEKPIEKVEVKVKEAVKVKASTQLKGLRKLIAERMSYSKNNIPHIISNVVGDATDLIKLKKQISADYREKITYTDFFLKICGLTLRENLEVNSSFQNERYIIYDDINVGLAVSVDEGVIVPTIYNCDTLGLVEIAKKRIELVDKARRGKLTLEEITNATFTLTNLGMYSIRSFSAIINPPQAAILAVGEIYPSPVVANSKIEIRFLVELSLSCDHRILDGVLGAKFLRRIVELIENSELVI